MRQDVRTERKAAPTAAAVPEPAVKHAHLQVTRQGALTEHIPVLTVVAERENVVRGVRRVVV